ncbi:MAG: hypothetical protein AAGI38_01840 [Bacteroidota bacterium]
MEVRKLSSKVLAADEQYKSVMQLLNELTEDKKEVKEKKMNVADIVEVASEKTQIESAILSQFS